MCYPFCSALFLFLSPSLSSHVLYYVVSLDWKVYNMYDTSMCWSPHLSCLVLFLVINANKDNLKKVMDKMVELI